MREHLIELIVIVKRLIGEVEPAADVGHRENLMELFGQLEDLLESIDSHE